MKIILKNSTSLELFEQIKPLGGTLTIARKLQASALRRNEWLKPVPGISEKVLSKIAMSGILPQLKIIKRIESPDDGFVRYVFQGGDDSLFEAVRIPLLHRADDKKYVVCVSSQAGCAMGCAFCFTGKMGFIRNLEPWEIVDQVARIALDSIYPVKGVVFMGMGEPMLNYDPVMKAAHILSEPCGMAISAKAITISTSGVVPGIQRFTKEGKPYRLIISLNSAFHEQRQIVMPVEKKWPIPELMQCIRDYHNSTGERVTLSWTLISGFNAGLNDAKELAVITKGMPVKIDLIDINDPTGQYKTASNEELNFFRDALRKELGMPVSRRYSGGTDINAGCGMLSGNNII